MRAAMLYGDHDLRIEAVDRPVPGPGEVLVRVRAATTCGTDVKIYQRGYVSGVIQYPTVFGHEWAGDVVEVGPGVPWVEEGMRVRAGNSGPCLKCGMCERGSYNLCENMTWLWGAYAEYIKVPSPIVRANLQELPSEVSYEEAAVAEPLACCLHGNARCQIQVGDSVAIIGDGPIGLLHLQLARLRGGRRVIVCGLVDARLQMARKLGADEVIQVRDADPVARVRELTNGGADVVIEAVGLPQTWEQALRMSRNGGTILEFGGCPPGTRISVDTEFLHYGERTLIGVFHTRPAYFVEALRLIASRMVEVQPLITRKMSLEEVNDAFRILTTTKKALKIAIVP
jgi:L-iditol 2-dehydrogenase